MIDAAGAVIERPEVSDLPTPSGLTPQAQWRLARH
ncbi:hypothetical protein HNQ73_002842 [Chelatococcus composti]|jgi:hypothetical protein|uniref:Uncharacterized protein n=1 Tax=Chelatococcus composti TaxID=1743235 RepID=A0A841KA95_9HYPH|nr:hypothetical protein [Chelatococcus composti]